MQYTRSDIKSLAREVVASSTTVTGVQAKLSLDIERRRDGRPQRFTIVGLWGRFILKPQTERYPHLPELEDLTMHLAEISGIHTVPHSLARFADGELCYITRRIDRTPRGAKIAMEDMCQLSERLTEYKYKGSHEQVSKVIAANSASPMLDVVNFWQLVVFCWITGNADMHLKNFSLYRPAGVYELAPAYDLLSTALVFPEDTEELALTLSGRKKKLKRADFERSMLAAGLNAKVISNIFDGFKKDMPKWFEFIDISFLPGDMKTAYKAKISEMLSRL